MKSKTASIGIFAGQRPDVDIRLGGQRPRARQPLKCYALIANADFLPAFAIVHGVHNRIVESNDDLLVNAFQENYLAIGTVSTK